MTDLSIATREVRDALPGAAAAAVTRVTVVREPKATFSVAPGQPKRPATRTPIPNLFLAGDWIDTGLPGTIESAAMSGHWAANAVLEMVSRVRTPGFGVWNPESGVPR